LYGLYCSPDEETVIRLRGNTPNTSLGPMNTNTKPFSPIREARLRAGLARHVLATRAGIHPNTLYWCERAPEVASERTIQAVAQVLDVPPDTLRAKE